MARKGINFTIEQDWLDQETTGCEFKDIRLGKRFKNILTQL